MRIVLLFTLVLLGCNRAPQGAPPAATSSTPITVVKPEQKALKRTIEQPGAIVANEETVLFPKLPGFVKTINVDIGCRVTAQQVLAEIALPELEQEFQQKEAVVRQTDAEVEQSKKALAASEAAVTAAKAHVTEAKAGLGRADANYARWKVEAERSAKLAGSGVIDSQTRDEIANQFKAAEASRTEAEARIVSAEASVAKAMADRDKATADIAAIEAKRDVARAEVRRLDALRDYQRIRAPFDGIVVRRSVSTGDHVTADGKSGLFAVARIDPVRVVLRVPEADAGFIELGQKAMLALPSAAVEGTVTRTSWSLDPGSRTLRVEIDLPNAKAKLRPGMYATAKLSVELAKEWTLPAAALGKNGDDTVAYLVENGKALRVPVQLGRGDGVSTQVRKYKKGTEWIAVSGTEQFATPAASLSDGQEIK